MDDFIPDKDFVPDAPPPAVGPTVAEALPEFIPDDPDSPDSLPGSDEERYGTPGQTALGVAEKFAQGVAGPLAPMAEVATGLTTPEDIRLRTQTTGGLGTIGELAGFGAGAFTGFGEAALLSKIGEGAKVAAGLGKATGLAGKLAAGSVKLGTEMAALQGGEEATKLVLKDPDQTAANAAVNVGLSAVLGTALGFGFAAVPPMWNATAGPSVEKILDKIKADWGFGGALPRDDHIVSPYLKQALSVFGGVSKENIEAYAANREAIRAAPEFHDLYSNVLDQLVEMAENIDAKKANVFNSRTKFDSFLKEQKLALKQAGYDAGAADTLAGEALKQAQTRLAQGLQEGALESAPKAFSAVQKLKEEALGLSQAARDILETTPGELSLKPIFQAVRPMQDKLYSLGFPTMAEELGKVMDIFSTQYGEKISYSDAKSMIQGLQQRGKWNFGANEVSNGLTSYFNQLSGIMNSALKEAVPAYEKAMRPTAEAFELLGKLDRYGTPESSVKGALGLKSAANYVNEMPLLRDLEAKTGVKFVNQLEHYANPAIRDGLSKALPEYAKSLRTAEALQQLKDPEVRAALEKSPFLSKPYSEMTRAEHALQSALERKQKLSGLSPATLEGKMKSAASGRSMHAREVLSHVVGMEDMSVPEILDLINVRDAFEKGAMNGSRNVNLWAKMVGGLSGVATGFLGDGGIMGAVAGTGVGAYIGGVLDKEGPAIVRNILDKYIEKYGDLPKAVGASPEATKAGLLHFLGKDVPVDAKAFKSTVGYIQDAKRGKNLLDRGAKAIFEGGKVLPQHLYPDSEKTKKLDERSKHLNENPKKMFDVGGGLGTYMPEHGQALTRATARIVGYINQYRPVPTKAAFLDEEVEPSEEQNKEFMNGLMIAQQPLVIFDNIKTNQLLPEDVKILSAIHPEYYEHMKKSVIHAMMDHTENNGKIPYKMRQSLSLFLGQELDSSLTPSNIMAAQSTFLAQKSAQQAPPKPSNKLDQDANRYQTAEQGDQARRARVQS